VLWRAVKRQYRASGNQNKLLTFLAFSVGHRYRTDTLKTVQRLWNGVLVIAMGTKRDRVEIMAEILGLCSKPQTKTRVMYGTNLSWKMLKHYISYMQEHRLLEEQEESTKFVTTDRGKEFVTKWKELKKLF
jgi:predicted transcriptional regulator